MSVRTRVVGIGISRFLVLLGLAFWLGGLFFFGAMTAPAIFKISRANGVGPIAPQMVGVMLTRFAFVTYGCGALMLIGWLGERFAGGVAGRWSQRTWWLQGACSALMLLIAIYLGSVLMPRINVMQGELLVPTSKMQGARAGAMSDEAAKVKTVWSEQLAAPVNAAVKDEFDHLHKSYSSWAMVAVYLGMTALAALAFRSALPIGSGESRVRSDRATPM